MDVILIIESMQVSHVSERIKKKESLEGNQFQQKQITWKCHFMVDFILESSA